MKPTLLLSILLLSLSLQAQTTLLSWNLQNLGSSKSDSTLVFIASQIKNFDIVALQEIVTNPSGPQAVAQLADLLNRTGTKWEYAVSDPTSSSAYKAERYAYLWKTARVKLQGKPWLEHHFAEEVDREPYLATFATTEGTFTVVNFHAITKKRQPEREIKYFKFLPERYPNLTLLFAGDFNCPETHTVFNPLKKIGWKPAFENQKTTLRTTCIQDDCLASPFDNIYYPKMKFKVVRQGIIRFYEALPDFKQARKISDHVPIWVELRKL